MKKNASLTIGILIGALATAIPFTFTSCGQLNAPLGVLGDSDSVPELGLPFTSSFYTFGTTNLSSSSAFVIGLSGATVPIAPAAGIVVSYDGTTMMIQHSNRLTSRLTNIPQPIIRVGDYVSTGQQLSSLNFSVTTFSYSVLLDGKTVCPWSFFSTSARGILSGSGSGSWAGAAFVPCLNN